MASIFRPYIRVSLTEWRAKGLIFGGADEDRGVEVAARPRAVPDTRTSSGISRRQYYFEQHRIQLTKAQRTERNTYNKPSGIS